MKFFREEQQKCIKCSSWRIQHHPMIMRSCLSLATKSASAYDEIQYNEKSGTNILIFQNRRRLIKTKLDVLAKTL